MYQHPPITLISSPREYPAMQHAVLRLAYAMVALCLSLSSLPLGSLLAERLCGHALVGGLLGLPVAQAADLTYIYDDLGRLKAVVDPTSETAIYTYDAVGNLLSITRQSSAVVSLIDFRPKSGPGGTTVTIHGTGFKTTASQNSVTFNGIAASVFSATATQLVVSVPGGAMSGPIGVSTASGSATSSSNFTVTTDGGSSGSPPTITSFSPTVGSPGTVVTITGTNLQPTPAHNKVRFNGGAAAVSAATATSLTTTVPVSGLSGPLSVTTPFGSAVSTGEFFIPPSPYTVTDVQITGRLTIGGAGKTVTIATANKIALLLFEGRAGQQVSLGVSGVTIPQSEVALYTPDRMQIAKVTGVGTTGDTLEVRLPVSGTYTIVVDPQSTYTGNAILTLSEDLLGMIAPGGAAVTVAIARPGQRARLTFSGSAGQKVSVAMSNVTIGSSPSCCGVDVYLLGPDGAFLAAVRVPNADEFLDPQQLSAAGLYTLLVDPHYANTGSITLTLYTVVDQTGPITAGGPAATVSLTTPGQSARLTFNGSAGQRVSLRTTTTTPSAFCATFKILQPDSTALLSLLRCGNTFIDTQTLAVSGTYTLVVDPSGVNTGSLTLTLYTVPNDVSGTITPGGASVPLSIGTPGQNARLTFNGSAGQRVSLRTTTTTPSALCATFKILQPDSTALLSLLRCGNTFIDTQTLAVSGTYTLVIDANNADTGSLTLTLYTVPNDVSGTLTVGGPAVTVSLATPGQNARLIFNGTQNQQVTVRLTSNTIDCITVKLLRPDSTALTSSLSCGSSFTLAPQTLPTTGTYTVSIDPIDTDTGSITVSVTSP